MPSVLEIKETLIDNLEADFVNAVKGVQDDLLTDVQKLLRDFERKKGRFVGSEKETSLIIQLKKELRNIVNKSDYPTKVTELLNGFDDIEENIKLIHKEYNSISVRNTLITPVKKALITDVQDNLLGAGIDTRFIDPVKKILFSNVNLGASVLDTEKQLRIMITGQKGEHGLLERWAGQVARDSSQQYEGSVNQIIKDEYDLNAIEYVGSLVRDSRAQCQKWVKKGVIFDKDLQKEIDWAKNGGTYYGKKVSGFILNTTIKTFCINRGGYNCRHTAIPVRR